MYAAENIELSLSKVMAAGTRRHTGSSVLTYYVSITVSSSKKMWFLGSCICGRRKAIWRNSSFVANCCFIMHSLFH